MADKSFPELLSWASDACSEFSLIWRDECTYSLVAVDFDKQIAPYLLKEKRVKEWPGTELMEEKATMKLYKVCRESLDVLRRVSSIYAFISPDYPEDLAFYINGEVSFASISHEGISWFES